MRPFYESSKDLATENEVAEALSKKTGYVFHKLKIAYHVDWLVMQENKPKYVAEIKRRFNVKDQYPTLMLSLHKWMNGKQMSKEMNVDFVVIIKWDDGVFCHAAGDSPVIYGFGGRKDRNDDQDQEPMVFIPVDKFKRIL
jgi:hypothetical protein